MVEIQVYRVVALPLLSVEAMEGAILLEPQVMAGSEVAVAVQPERIPRLASRGVLQPRVKVVRVERTRTYVQALTLPQVKVVVGLVRQRLTPYPLHLLAAA